MRGSLGYQKSLCPASSSQALVGLQHLAYDLHAARTLLTLTSLAAGSSLELG